MERFAQICVGCCIILFFVVLAAWMLILFPLITGISLGAIFGIAALGYIIAAILSFFDYVIDRSSENDD